MALINELEKIGLSEKETKVFLAALELGQDSVQNIAKKSGVNRATTYVVLETLIKKGLCSTFEQGKKTFYLANNPESLQGLFELQKKEVEERQKYFNLLLPNLQLIYNRQENKPVVRFFEGKQGLFSCLEEFLSHYKEGGDQFARMVYNRDLLDKAIPPDEREKFRAVRLKYQVKSRVLYNFSGGEIATSADGERRQISAADFPISCDLGIYNDCLYMASLKQPLSAILIIDQQLADSFKSIFDLAWLGAKGVAAK